MRALTYLGCSVEAEAFRRFIQRNAAGSAEELHVMSSPSGERRLTESELPWTATGRPSRPGRESRVAAESDGPLRRAARAHVAVAPDRALAG